MNPDINQRTDRPRVLVISLSDLSTDPRVERQLRFLLQRECELSTLALGAAQLSGIRHIPLKEPKILGRIRKLHHLARLIGRPFGLLTPLFWIDPCVKACMSALGDESFDLVITNELETLPIALHCVGEGGRVMFDAHEYAPRESEDSWKWRLLYQPMRKHLCKKYLAKADVITAVCPGIAVEYSKNYAVPVSVIMNAPSKSKLEPTIPSPGRIKMIYHGMISPDRRVEQALDVMDQLDERFYLDMILIPGDEEYITRLSQRIEGMPRVRIIERVPMLEIPKLCNQYDIGFYPLQPSNFNCQHALPNKFFEFIQARILPAVTPQKDMGDLVRKYQCGLVSPDYSSESMVEALNSLTHEQIVQMKQNCNQAAEALNAEANEKVFEQLLSPFLSRASTLCK